MTCMFNVYFKEELGVTEAPTTPRAWRPRRDVDEALMYMTPSPESVIRVKWQLSDIDYPVCLSHFQLVYYAIFCNETKHQMVVKRCVTLC